MIENGVDGHNDEEREGCADMDRNKERHDGEEPGRADGLNWVKRKTSPGRRLHGTMMAFVSPFK